MSMAFLATAAKLTTLTCPLVYSLPRFPTATTQIATLGVPNAENGMTRMALRAPIRRSGRGRRTIPRAVNQKRPAGNPPLSRWRSPCTNQGQGSLTPVPLTTRRTATTNSRRQLLIPSLTRLHRTHPSRPPSRRRRLRRTAPLRLPPPPRRPRQRTPRTHLQMRRLRRPLRDTRIIPLRRMAMPLTHLCRRGPTTAAATRRPLPPLRSRRAVRVSRRSAKATSEAAVRAAARRGARAAGAGRERCAVGPAAWI